MKNNLQKNLKFILFLLAAFIIVSGFAKEEKITVSMLSGTIACNDTVSIAMDTLCEALVHPDQILEGNYPDYSIFIVDVKDMNGQSLGDALDKDQVGLVLPVEVTDTITNNKCWGHIKVIDKIAPPLLCEPLFTTCAAEPLPGSLLPKNFRFAYDPNEAIPDEDTLILNLDVGNMPGALITDMNIRLIIDHTRVLDLEAFIISPGGVRVDLFDLLTCGNANFDVTFDDEAKKTAGELSSECCVCDPTVQGRFRPLENLSIYNNTSPEGTWVLYVIDKNPGYTGTVKRVELLFRQTGGILSFPIPLGSSQPVQVDDYRYIVESGFDPCGSVILSYKDTFIEQECSSGLSAIINREWRAEDESGNVSYCTQLIYVIYTGISLLEFPPNYDNIEEPALSCDPENPDFYPTPEITGYPGIELCEGVMVSYEDESDEICSGSFKVFRKWIVSDICDPSNVVEHYQMIVVRDTIKPVLSQIQDTIVFNTSSLECYADIILDMPLVLEECSDPDKIIYALSYFILDKYGNPVSAYPITTGLQKLTNTRFRLKNAPMGSYRFIYTVTDDCGNSSVVENIVIVIDNAPPVAVCDQFTVISIGVDGLAKVSAFVFDDGSHDNCSDVTFQARRMTTTCVMSDLLFQDSITFCCDDVNTVQIVEMKVTDAMGLSNICMVEAHVHDKIPPVIICPKTVVLSCHDDYTDLSLTGIPQVFDNCGIDTVYYSDIVDIDNCHTGTALRTWYAKDVNGLRSECLQIILKENFNPFRPSDIIWPKNVTLYDCDAKYDTATIGGVRVKNENICSMVSARYSDEIYNVVAGACFKVLRHWEVIDWCNYNEYDPESSIYRKTQEIVIVNNVAPEFSSCRNRTFCTFGACEGEIEYIQIATDDCTPEELLWWSYRIDIGNNGVWDTGPVLSNNASGMYENGVYRVAWTVEDGCGNKSVCEELIVVKDCKKPTPLCITHLTTAVMDQSGMAVICAESFNLGECGLCDKGSYDNCTPRDKLRYSFSTDVDDTCKVFTCDDIINGENAYISLDMWVTDEEGNQDFCSVTIELQDNEADICPEISIGSLVYGAITDPGSRAMENVSVQLVPEDGIFRYNLTANNGRYKFDNVDAEKTHNIKPLLQTEYMLGISTLDIVLIQQHILGIKQFDAGYKHIAADVNRSGSVTASDILMIRKLILGESNNFVNGDNAWVFVRDDAELMQDPNILLHWKDNIDIDHTDLDSNIDWIGIKLGDVNNSNNYAQNSSNLEPRSSEVMELVFENKPFSRGERVDIDLLIKNTEKLSGAQMTLNFDTEILKFENLELNHKLISSNEISIAHVDRGKIVMSWVNPEIDYEGEQFLFTAIFESKNTGIVSECIYLSDDIAKTEAYNTKLDVMDVRLITRGESEYLVYQNVPNPFRSETKIMFEMPESGPATLEFFDMTGRIISQVTGEYNEGANSVIVRFDEHLSGLIYCRLSTKDYSQTIKMLKTR